MTRVILEMNRFVVFLFLDQELLLLFDQRMKVKIGTEEEEMYLEVIFSFVIFTVFRNEFYVYEIFSSYLLKVIT